LKGLLIPPAMQVPGELFVELEPGHEKACCAGRYQLVVGETPNGLPCWAKEAADDSRYIFSSPGGTWFICDKTNKEQADAIAKGWGEVRSHVRHGGSLPHEIPDWDYMLSKEWKTDPGIRVAAEMPEAPQFLWVSLPVGHPKARCGGRYQLVESECPNGVPVYVKEAFHQTWHLFSSPGGTWFLAADAENKRLGFCKSRGEVKSCVRHGGSLPHQVNAWMQWNGKEWFKDADISILTEMPEVPRSIFVKLKPGHPVANCAGLYQHGDGEFANGMPVFAKEAGGMTLYLYSSPSGHWCTSSNAKQELFNCDRARLGSKSCHGGQLPHEVGEDWCYSGDKKDEWLPEPACQVSAMDSSISPASGTGSSPSTRSTRKSWPVGDPASPSLGKAGGNTLGETKRPFSVMFSGRFHGGPREKHLRDTAHCLAKHRDLQVLVVEAHAGECFDEQTEQHLHKCQALVCMAYEDYGEKTDSKYCTYYELQYADDYNKEILPVKLYRGDWPPAPDEFGEARNKRILRPSRVFIDGVTKDGVLAPEELAERLYDHLQRFIC